MTRADRSVALICATDEKHEPFAFSEYVETAVECLVQYRLVDSEHSAAHVGELFPLTEGLDTRRAHEVHWNGGTQRRAAMVGAHCSERVVGKFEFLLAEKALFMIVYDVRRRCDNQSRSCP